MKAYYDVSFLKFVMLELQWTRTTKRVKLGYLSKIWRTYSKIRRGE